MKVKIARKDIIGYVFLLIVAAACITIGIRVLQNHHPTSAAFSLAMGVGIIAAAVSMVLRKD